MTWPEEAIDKPTVSSAAPRHGTVPACTSPQLVHVAPFDETWICQYTMLGAIAGTVMVQPEEQAIEVVPVSLSKLYGLPLAVDVLQASARPLQ